MPRKECIVSLWSTQFLDKLSLRFLQLTIEKIFRSGWKPSGSISLTLVSRYLDLFIVYSHNLRGGTQYYSIKPVILQFIAAIFICLRKWLWIISARCFVLSPFPLPVLSCAFEFPASLPHTLKFHSSLKQSDHILSNNRFLAASGSVFDWRDMKPFEEQKTSRIMMFQKYWIIQKEPHFYLAFC